MDEEIAKLREWKGEMETRVRLLERVVYGAVAVMLVTQVAALVALVTRLPAH